MKLLSKYPNGNYTVKIFDDGTKIRENNLDNLTPEFPESIDFKITNCCNVNCQFCHEDSTKEGKHSDLLNLKFLDTLNPFTELAIGGGNPLANPQILPFLRKMKERKVIVNMTIHPLNIAGYWGELNTILEENLITAFGLSSVIRGIPYGVLEKINKIIARSTTVFHVILGVNSIENIIKLMQDYKNAKILILGYKYFGRGETYEHVTYNTNKADTELLFEKAQEYGAILSFDNLALKQMPVKDVLKTKKPELFKQGFMGDDGQYTMYIDGVSGTFAKNSTTAHEQRFALKEDIVEMFEMVRN